MDPAEPDFEEHRLVFVPDFPLDDVKAVMELLASANILVAGYEVTSAGFYDIEAHIFSAYVARQETILLPDRNVTSRLAQIIRGEPIGQKDPQRRHAAAVMAFAQCFNVKIEPSISFHELASREGNAKALDELAWFRAADRAQPFLWLDLALDRLSQVDRHGSAPPLPQFYDLAKPLRRWRRNYVLALKIAELELTTAKPLARILAFFQWMDSDFMVGGPAAILACLYFSSGFPRKRLLKSLKSKDRERAINGVKNAAWDLTHLSDFIERVNAEKDSQKAYVFASFDAGLLQLASIALGSSLNADVRTTLAKGLSSWWPDREANQISATLMELIEAAAADRTERQARQRTRAVSIDNMIVVGEAIVRSASTGE